MLRSNVMQRANGRAFDRAYDRLERAAIAAARRNDAMLLYVPDSRRGVFQDSTGTTAAGVGDPIGLLLDRQYDAQADYITGAWTLSSPAVSAFATAVAFSAAPANSFADLNADLTAGKSYVVEYTVSAVPAGDVRVILYANGYYAVSVTRSAAGTYREVLTLSTAGGSKTDTIRIASGTVTATATVTGLSVKEVIGYRAVQATAANKPTLVKIARRTGPELATVGSVAGVAVGGPTVTEYALGAVVRAGATYRVRFTVADYSGTGTVGLISVASVSANGYYEYYLTATVASELKAFTRSANTCNFSGISVAEVLEWSNAIELNGTGNWMDVAYRDYLSLGEFTFVGSWASPVGGNSATVLAQTSTTSINPLISPLFVAVGSNHATLFERGDTGTFGLAGSAYAIATFLGGDCVELQRTSSGSVGNFRGWRKGQSHSDSNYTAVTESITTNKVTLGAAQRTTLANFAKGTFVLLCWAPRAMPVADRKAVARFASYLIGANYYG